MTRIATVQGDITKVTTDAIVNAANKELRPGGGVDGAIHAAGGPSIAREAREIAVRDGHLPTGQAVATTAGRLPAGHVIHTVGPIWGRVSEEEAVRLLADCYANSLNLAVSIGCQSIAFPNISTGVYGFPKELAAETAVKTVEDWVESHPDALETITFVSFNDENQQIYMGLVDG